MTAGLDIHRSVTRPWCWAKCWLVGETECGQSQFPWTLCPVLEGSLGMVTEQH